MLPQKRTAAIDKEIYSTSPFYYEFKIFLKQPVYKRSRQRHKIPRGDDR